MTRRSGAWVNLPSQGGAGVGGGGGRFLLARTRDNADPGVFKGAIPTSLLPSAARCL